MSAFIESLVDRLSRREPVSVVGGGTQSFLAGRLQDAPVSMGDYSGVVNYEPTELVLTARAGTTLVEIEQLLAASQQMLPFEPPMYGDTSTLGGAMATGLSGPRRIHLGSARDAVLGVRLINGLGEQLKFGGEVMKNVAGYDISRLSVGAYGTLGILTDISVKVLPVPESEQTRVFALDAPSALSMLARIGRLPYPISAATWFENQLYVRLSGAARGVGAAARALGGELLHEADDFWRAIRQHRHAAFTRQDQWLWRLSVPPTTPVEACPASIIDWAGAQRWVFAAPGDFGVFAQAARVGGHATCFAKDREVGTGLQPLDAGVARLNQRIRDAMDPYHLLNRGRLFEVDV